MDAQPMSNAAPPPSRKLTLAEAVAEVEAICLEIDDAGVVPMSTVARLDDARATLADRADSWIARRQAAEALIAVCEVRKRNASEALVRSKTALDRIDDYLKTLLEQAPGVLFKGDLGRIAVQKNSSASLALNLPTQRVSFEETLTADQLTPGVDEYVEEKTFYVVRKKQIIDAIKAGKNFGWAVATTGNHVRIR